MKPSPTSYRSVVTIAVGICAIAYLFKIPNLYYISFFVALLSLLHPFIAVWIEKIWMGIGKALGFVNSRIILGIVFFLFLTPIAFLFRTFARKSRIQSESSNFKIVNRPFSKKQFEKMF
jgi:hypothetical protein